MKMTMMMLVKFADQKVFPRHAIFKVVVCAIFLNEYQFYKRCFEYRRVCVFMTFLYQSKVACIAPAS